MEDDIALGASVWGASPGPASVAASSNDFEEPGSSAPSDSADFDDFDDFDTSAQPNAADEDDFGDFGDFGEADMSTPANLEESSTGFADEPIAMVAGSPSGWAPLKLDPNDLSRRVDLEEQVEEILRPIFEYVNISSVTTSEGIRDVEGISQILASRESRDLYNSLVRSPPPTKPPNWTRSRIRRQHLISLGIPVNLDEMLPTSNGKALPMLHVTTRPMSAPPGPRSSSRAPNGTNSTVPSRSGTPQPHSRSAPSPLGEKPVLDEARIARVLEVGADDLTLLPINTLEKHLAELREQTASASALLTYLLQSREALQQDSETYNGLIAELVGEAQKAKMGKGRTPLRKGSAFT